MISGYFATLSHLSLCKCSFCMGLPRWSELAATTILPLSAAGLAGSNVTDPEMAVAVPLIDSNGASVLKMTLLTPLGSLKSKVNGAPEQTVATHAPTMKRNDLCFILD